METNKPHALPPISLFVKEGFSFIKTNWQKLVPYFAIIFGIEFVLTVAIVFTKQIVVLGVPLAIIDTLVNVLVFYLAFASDIWNQQVDTKTDMSIWSTYKKAVSLFPQLLWGVLLANLVSLTLFFLFAILPAAILVVLSIALSSFIGGTAGLIVFVVLVGVIAILAVIVFQTCILGTLFVSYTVLLEGKRGMEAVMQPFWYAKGRRLALFVRFLALYIISGIGSVILLVAAYSTILFDYSFPELIQILESGVEVHLSLPFTLIVLFVVFVSSSLFHLFYSGYGYMLWKHARATAGTEESIVQYKTAMKPKFKAMEIAAWPIILILGFVFIIIVSQVSSILNSNELVGAQPSNVETVLETDAVLEEEL